MKTITKNALFMPDFGPAIEWEIKQTASGVCM